MLEVDLPAILSDVDPRTPVRVAGNLPYNVSSPILFRLLQLQTQPAAVTDATVMLQREVADRIVAKPGTSEYGVLSVLVQWRADVSRILTLPPGRLSARRPPSIRPSSGSPFGRRWFTVADDRALEGMVRSMFTHRRKTLANALAPFAASVGVSGDDRAARRRRSIRNGGPRRWRSLKSHDLPTLFLRQKHEVCYPFALSFRQHPAAWPRGRV